MSTASELADRLEARAKEIDECIRGGDYGTGTGADNAARMKRKGELAALARNRRGI